MFDLSYTRKLFKGSKISLHLPKKSTLEGKGGESFPSKEGGTSGLFEKGRPELFNVVPLTEGKPRVSGGH